MSDTSGLLSQFYVKINGADASEDLMRDLLQASVESSLHLPDVATLVLHDPQLRWIDDVSLEPGAAIEVSAKGPQKTEVLFDGEIVEIEPEFGPGTHRLVVRAFDRLHRLARGRQVRSFVNVNDGDLIKSIAPEAGLQAVVGPTPQVYDYIFQDNQTNLEFLRARAASLGYLLYVRGKTLHCEAPRAGGPVATLEWGVTLSEFRPRLTTVDQVNEVVARGWDPASRQEIVGQTQNGHGAPQIGQHKSGGDLSRDAFNVTAQSQLSDRPVRSQALADRLAQAEADRRVGRFVEAEGTCSGNPAITAGSTVEIRAVGDRFSGTYFVTGATHRYTAEHGYGTEFSVSGHRPANMLAIVAEDEPRRSATGLVIGVVTDNQDPEGQGRVKVKFPWLTSDHTSDWARVVVPGGGPERGIEFLPEVNDEVLVGFEMGDVHYPYVLGGLWNGQDAPPEKSSAVIKGGQVQRRVIRSRSGHIITLDDTDGAGGITIEDKNGNQVMLDTAANKLTIKVQGDTVLEAGGNLTLQAQGQIQIKGMGITIDAGMATVDIKGSMINLN